MSEDVFLNLTGLWKNEKGNLTGKLGNLKVVIYPNKYKEQGDNKPDFNLALCKPRKMETSGAHHSKVQPNFNTQEEIPF